MADQLSEEIIYKILSRLPIKSLARFRCVNKLWLEYINDPYLETIHVTEEPTPIIFHLYLAHDSCSKIKQHCNISLLRVIQGTMTLKKDPVLEFCYEYTQNLVLGSCNGLTLTLLFYEENFSHDIFQMAVINPLSKQSYNLPPLDIRPPFAHEFFQVDEVGIGFGYDDSTNTFKTVCVVLEWSQQSLYVGPKYLRTMVHSSGMRSWREIPQIPAYPIIGEGVFSHGRLYWLVYGLDSPSPMYERKLAWFDVKAEEFGLIDPLERKGGEQIDDHLVDLNGEVGFAYIDDNHIELWILEEEEWVLHCKFDLNPSLHRVKVSGCWNKEGDILFTSKSNDARRLFVYTMKTGDLREVDWEDRCDADIKMYQSSLSSIRKLKN